MKTLNYILYCSILLAGTACTDFDELNSDPNKSTDMDPNLQIATVQMRQSEDHQEWHRYLIYPGGFMAQWAGEWATVDYGGKAKRNAAYMEYMWIMYYPYIIRDVVDVVERTKGNPKYVNVNAVGRILKVENFLRLTDYYGDIPYSNAGMGYYSGDFNAKYDPQEQIYNDFFNELTTAAAALTVGGDPLSHDLYYNGDIEKWRRFANSLHLRIAMRLIKVNPAKAREEAEKAIARGVLNSNSDICYVKHEDHQNPGDGKGAGNGLTTRLSNQGAAATNAFRLTTELVTAMEDRKDPRILYYGGMYLNTGAAPDILQPVRDTLAKLLEVTTCPLSYITTPAQYFSYDNLDGRPEIKIELGGQQVSVPHSYQRLQPNKMIQKFDAPFIHMTYAEVEFLLAEAAQRGWNAGGETAEEHFVKGLEAAVRQWSLFGVTNFNNTAIADFVNYNKANFAGNELVEINTQLWILHFMDPLETWSNWRRTGIPDLNFVVFPDNTSGGQIPRRIEYPKDEQMKNPTFYNEALDRMGGTDSWTNRVWWDVP
ncbi:hypothetical protein FACS1894156_0260 [Bacteroidia bacterium]|nr:hypothetical protein FACS1894156_0260 [Bacteroidia bacterium]